MNILSLQSHVAYGHVGNSAAVFALQRLGVEVWPIHTVQFSNHTGYATARGHAFNAAHIRELTQGLRERDVLRHCDGVLSGYVGSAEVGAAILEAVAEVKQANPRAVYCCDPVIGDVERGAFVKPEVADFICAHAVPAADIVTPNHFELEHLTGNKVATMADALAAARSLLKGPRLALITSLRRADAPADQVEMVAVSHDAAWRIATPLIGFEIAPNGTGDAVAALFSAHWIESGDAPAALGKAASSIYAVLEATAAMGERELQLVAAQDRMISPSRHFTAEKL